MVLAIYNTAIAASSSIFHKNGNSLAIPTYKCHTKVQSAAPLDKASQKSLSLISTIKAYWFMAPTRMWLSFLRTTNQKKELQLIIHDETQRKTTICDLAAGLCVTFTR